ncbi:hypothetical protein FisN_2Lh341 [Fistulifera solaris]|uniref:Dirigent protein n=1 Tax=Fistulifera solaris TaxID=1519565 RepID=A0A1Z5J7V0_FISSO|nr:hypothetical protein FisN_2Lh341 [Fistulifera solaris]|eukprot:GAX10073.1 hypothetical protein FisN_2Lh341 [Fistulifera solaris]
MTKYLIFAQALLLLSIQSVAGQRTENSLRGTVSQGAPHRALRSDDDGYYDDDGYTDDYADDYYYEGGKGKGKGKGKGNGGGKGKGKGKGGKKGKKSSKHHAHDYSYQEKGDWNELYPSVGDINFLDDNFFDDNFFADGDCKLVVMNETFSVPRALSYVAPDTTSPENMGDPVLAGTVFLWRNQQVFEADGSVPIAGTTVSGTCTRTNQDGENSMGSCQFVFVDDDDYTITVDGALTGPYGSSLGITGGTGGMVGVVGQMDFFPVHEEDDDAAGDIFINVTRYEIEADLGLIICPTH